MHSPDAASYISLAILYTGIHHTLSGVRTPFTPAPRFPQLLYGLAAEGYVVVATEAGLAGGASRGPWGRPDAA